MARVQPGPARQHLRQQSQRDAGGQLAWGAAGQSADQADWHAVRGCLSSLLLCIAAGFG